MARSGLSQSVTENERAFQAKLALNFDEFARIVQQQIDGLSAVVGNELQVKQLIRLRRLAKLGARKARMRLRRDQSNATRSAGV